MKLEQLLSEQGADPLSNQVNGGPLRAFINANFKRLGIEVIDQNTPCDTILERIYGIEDVTTQNNLLNRPVGDVKGDLNFKRILMGGSLILVIIVGGVFYNGMITGTPLSSESVDLLKTIASGILDLFKDREQ